MIEVLAGVAVGVLTILLARILRGQGWLYSIGLLTLPVLYASFALAAGEQSTAIKELIYGAPYLLAGIIFAFVSLRWSAVSVGALWIAHGVYDLIHGRIITNIGVPVWYPLFCFSVDIVVGAYLVWLSRRPAPLAT